MGINFRLYDPIMKQNEATEIQPFIKKIKSLKAKEDYLSSKHFPKEHTIIVFVPSLPDLSGVS